MISEFPHVNEKTKAKLKQWLTTQHRLSMSDCYKYEACGNQEAADRARYRASTFASIKVHLEHHMEAK